MVTDIILFDAANTLIHKPLLWTKFGDVLKKHGITIDLSRLEKQHKIISEVMTFPDRTNRDFYFNFNSELLLSLGVLPTDELLSEVFEACSYLPWKAFEDVKSLSTLKNKVGVVSNFNSSLNSLLADLIPEVKFERTFISEDEKVRKPSIKFYELVQQKLNITAENILYVGDSLKLDIIPARAVGFRTCLIDRNNYYPDYKERISSLHDLINFI